MKLKKYGVGLFLLGFFLIGLSIVEVQALNYTPAVDVGDVLVWRGESVYNNTNEISYRRYNITSIEDDGAGKTVVNASYSISNDNLNYTFVHNRTVGTLQDYSLERWCLYGDMIIVPGTIVEDHISIYQDIFDYATVTAINHGYGIRLDWHVYGDLYAWREFEYNKDGIEIKNIRHDLHTSGGFYDYEKYLYSINGELYEYKSPKSIPGYSLYILVGSSFVVITGLLIYINKRKSMK